MRRLLPLPPLRPWGVLPLKPILARFGHAFRFRDLAPFIYCSRCGSCDVHLSPGYEDSELHKGAPGGGPVSRYGRRPPEPLPRLGGCVGSLDGIWAICLTCRRSEKVPLGLLLEKLGPEFVVIDVWMRLRSSGCGRKEVESASSWLPLEGQGVSAAVVQKRREAATISAVL